MTRRMPPYTTRPSCFLIVGLAVFPATFLAFDLQLAAAQMPAAAEDAQAGNAGKKPEIKGRLGRMRERVAGIKPWVQSGSERKRLDRVEEPLFRLVDPTRNYPDGTLWAWPEKGRPQVLVTLSVLANSQTSSWLYEFASLSEHEVGAEFGPDFAKWSALRPGWEPQTFRDAPAPAESKSERLRQMRDLARRFKAVELLPPPTRFELRLLPQPVVRYADADAGQLDGAVFLLCHGTNPEIVLVIEAKQESDQPPVWQYGFARNTIAELHVTLDGAEVWTQPHVAFTAAYADGPFTIALQPVSASEQPDIEAEGAQ